MDNIDFESAGRFRRIDSIGIRGVDLAVSPAMLIEGELERILDSYYQSIQNGGHPFEEAVLFHYMFELIHPFTDGNGRVGREILNKMLLDAGFPRLTVSESERERYIKALQLGNNKQYREMILIFIELLEDRRATIFQEILEGKYS
jgi:Fic family protein